METQLVRITDESSFESIIAAAAGVIRSGGLVGFPTETVYGIAAAARRVSIDRLDRVKERPPGKPYTLHIGSPSDVSKYVAYRDPRIGKLTRRAWPGPLTIVFPLDDATLLRQRDTLGEEAFTILYQDSKVGVRCPDHPVATALLKAASLPVVAPSANQSGQPPAGTADEVLSCLPGWLDMVLDYGTQPCRGISSTVIQVGGPRFKVLREGAYSLSQLAKMWRISILFVCTGNTCRSPLAEAFGRKRLSEKLGCMVDDLDKLGYTIGSVGVSAADGMPASPEVVTICRDRGVGIMAHRSRMLDADKLNEADYVFAMTEGQRRRILEQWPEADLKVRLLDDGGDVPDPIGGSLEDYRRCAARIQNAVDRRMDEIVE